MRRIARLVAAIIALPALYFVAAVLGALLPAGGGSASASGLTDGPTVTVKLARGPIHYDVLLPADPRTKAIFARTASDGVPVGHPGVRWIIVGWGARDFYTTAGTYSDISARAVWRGITGDDSVLRIDVAGDIPEDAPDIVTIALTQDQYDALLGGIGRSMTGAPAIDHPGLTATDAFYPAKGRFHLFRTCNVWVGEQLREAGLRIGIWTPIPLSVSLTLSRFQPTG